MTILALLVFIDKNNELLFRLGGIKPVEGPGIVICRDAFITYIDQDGARQNIFLDSTLSGIERKFSFASAISGAKKISLGSIFSRRFPEYSFRK